MAYDVSTGYFSNNTHIVCKNDFFYSKFRSVQPKSLMPPLNRDIMGKTPTVYFAVPHPYPQTVVAARPSIKRRTLAVRAPSLYLSHIAAGSVSISKPER